MVGEQAERRGGKLGKFVAPPAVKKEFPAGSLAAELGISSRTLAILVARGPWKAEKFKEKQREMLLLTPEVEHALRTHHAKHTLASMLWRRKGLTDARVRSALAVNGKITSNSKLMEKMGSKIRVLRINGVGYVHNDDVPKLEELVRAMSRVRDNRKTLEAIAEKYEERLPASGKKDYEPRTPLELFVASKSMPKKGSGLDAALKKLRGKQEELCWEKERAEARVAFEEKALQEAEQALKSRKGRRGKRGRKQARPRLRLPQTPPVSRLPPAPKAFYDSNELSRQYHLQGPAAPHAEKVFNAFCSTRLHQLLVEHNLKKLLAETSGSGARDTISHYLQLLHDSAGSQAGGGLHEQFAAELHSLIELGLPPVELAGVLGNLSSMRPPERRPQILARFLHKISEYSLAPGFSFQELMNKSFFAPHEVRLGERTLVDKVTARHPLLQPGDFKGVAEADLHNFLSMTTSEVRGALHRMRERRASAESAHPSGIKPPK